MSSSTYEHDFHAWTREQTSLLRERRFVEADIDHLIEELEDMGARQRRELQNRLKVLLAHLLKWQCQPQRRSHSWLATIKEQRLSLADLLADNPSLAPLLDEQRLAKAWRSARLLAVAETNLPEETFPADCPWSVSAVRDEAFYPD